MELRQYQKDAIKAIVNAGKGSFAIALPTASGKTVTFSHLPREGKTLILSHRQELVYQVQDDYDCKVGFEIGKDVSNGEEVVSASFQTMHKRKEKFAPDYFHRIIVDEFHNSAAKTFKSTIEYFKPYQLIGVSATPFRNDGEDLSSLFSKIIFERDIKWGISEGWLARLNCKRVNIGYDLSNIKSDANDYTVKELEKRVNIEGANKALAKIYKECEKPALIFCVNIAHCEAVAEQIPNSVVVTGKTKKDTRKQILLDFNNNKIDCLINCQIFTEGVNTKAARSLILARPTKSQVLYTQMVGRGLRKYEGKDTATLYDCIGATRRLDLCTAPCLLGIDMDAVPDGVEIEIEGDLLDQIPDLIESKSDVPESWVKNMELVDLWKKKRKLNTYNVDYFKFPDGTLLVGLPENSYIGITKEDAIGDCRVFTNKLEYEKRKIQENLLKVFEILKKHKNKESPIWNTKSKKRWGKKPASEKQKQFAYRMLKSQNLSINLNDLNMMQVSAIINKIKYERRIK